MQAFVETVFDAFYLSTVVFLGIQMVRRCEGGRQFYLFGIMALVLGFGDAFHLVPRAIALNTTGLEDYTFALGLGKAITSVTMTLFYVLLYYVWRERYEVRGRKEVTLMVWLLSALRIVLSLFPQNEWFSKMPPLSWGIYRNIPFALLGLVVIILFYRSAREQDDRNFRHLWLTIVFSFGFYIPVVLFADRIPLIGMLMIPKTCAYIWTVLIGYEAMKKEAGRRKEISYIYEDL